MAPPMNAAANIITPGVAIQLKVSTPGFSPQYTVTVEVAETSRSWTGGQSVLESSRKSSTRMNGDQARKPSASPTEDLPASASMAYSEPKAGFRTRMYNTTATMLEIPPTMSGSSGPAT